MIKINLTSNILNNYKIENNNFLNFNIKDFLLDYYEISSRCFKNLCDNNAITICSNNIEYHYTNTQPTILKPFDKIILNINYDEDNSNIKNSIFPSYNLDILYEDEYLIVFYKDKNYPVMQVSSHINDTYSNIIKDYYDKNNIKKKIRFVTRLDKQTTGIVLIAKSGYIHDILSKMGNAGLIEKHYLALTTKLDLDVSYKFSLISNISKDASSIKRISKTIQENYYDYNNYNYNDNNKNINRNNIINNSQTIFEILKQNDDSTLIKCTLKTGKCHQIRSQLMSINTFILGDEIYNNDDSIKLTKNYIDQKIITDDTFTLCAYNLKFQHPITKEILEFKKTPYWA